MKLKELFENWSLTGLKINAVFMNMEWKPQDADKNAAWELYVELITRITTQALTIDIGAEKAALDSIHSLFPSTRGILKHYGRACISFSKIAVIVLNQVVRPFTSKWHKIFTDEDVNNKGLREELRDEFRRELNEIQVKLIAYAHLLSNIADVEDITSLEEK